MNIAVISPHYRSTGNTTVASLLGLELANRGGKTCITHSLARSESIYKYLGVESIQDKTVNPARLVRMIKGGVLKPEEISDYCRSINSRLDLFSADSDTFTQEDMILALDCIVNSFPHDYIVYDIDNKELESEGNRLILKNADVVIVVVTQDAMELEEFRKSREKILKALDGLPQLVVINKYCEVIGSLKDTAAMMGIKSPKNWSTVRYNPWVGFGTNNGRLCEIYRNISLSDYRVIDVGSDIRAVANLVLNVKAANRKLNKKLLRRRLGVRQGMGVDQSND